MKIRLLTRTGTVLNKMSERSFVLPCALTALVLRLSSLAYGQTVTVPGTAAIQLAGQPDRTLLCCDDEGPDSAPVNAPSEIAVSAGGKVTLTAEGFTCNGVCIGGWCCATSPDGGQGAGIVYGGAHFGLSSWTISP